MKIETDIVRTRAGEIVWADDNPSGYGIQVHRAGKEVSDSWLLKNGLIDPEPEPEVPKEKEPEAPKVPAKTAAAKQSPKPADKSVKSPAGDK